MERYCFSFWERTDNTNALSIAGDFSNAQVISRASFKGGTNSDVADGTLHWVKITGGYISNGVDLLKVDLQAGETLIVDIDYGDSYVTNNNDPDDECYSNIFDCNFVCDGSAFIDVCGNCVEGTTGLVENYEMDCTGTCYGAAYVDGCGECSEGTSGHVADSSKDCGGVCFGVLLH